MLKEAIHDRYTPPVAGATLSPRPEPPQGACMKFITGRDRSLPLISAPGQAPISRFTLAFRRIHIPRGILVALAVWLSLGASCYPIKPLPAVKGAKYVKFPATIKFTGSFYGAWLHGQYLLPAKGSARGTVARPGPGVVLIPAFNFMGWREADGLAQRFSRAGYHVLLLSVRGTRGTGGKDDCGLAQTADVLAALDWMAGQKGVRPRALAVVGLGRGGQLALLAAAGGGKARAVAAFGAPAEISSWRATTGHPGIAEWIGAVCGEGDQARLRSPVPAAGRIKSPVLLIHGEDNRRVPPAQSRLMRDALTRKGSGVETLFLPGATHRLTPEQFEKAWRRLLAFLQKALR